MSRAIDSRAALAALPVTRKSRAGRAADARAALRRPERDAALGTRAHLRLARARSTIPRDAAPTSGARRAALFAAGFRAGDLVHNCFSYHLTPAGSMFETGLHRLGCTVIPGGTGQTELQAQAIADLRPTGYVGTPSFLKLILEKGDELGVDPTSPRARAGLGRSVPAARCARSSPRAASRRTRPTAPPTSASSPTRRAAREGLVVDEGVIVEIVRPGTGDPVRRGRGRRGRRDAVQPRLSADPLRHRRSLRGAAGREPLRAHQHAHQGLDGTRRPDDQGAGHVRASAPGGRGAAPPRARARAAGGRQRGGRRPHDAARRAPRAPPTQRSPAASRQALRDVTKVRGEVRFRRPGSLPERRQGDRGRAGITRSASGRLAREKPDKISGWKFRGGSGGIGPERGCPLFDKTPPVG